MGKMRIFSCVLLAGLLTLPGTAFSARSELPNQVTPFAAAARSGRYDTAGAKLYYGQSRRFLNQYSGIEKKDFDPAAARETMAAMAGNYELALGSVTLFAEIPVPPFEGSRWPERVYYSFNVDGAAALEYRDPLMPEMRAGRIAGLYATLGYTGAVWEDFYFQFGMALGAGHEARYVFRDTLNMAAPASRASGKAVAAMGGVDLKIQKVWRFSGGQRLIHTLQTEESYFRAFNNQIVGDLNWNLRSVSHDWLFRNDFRWGVFGLHGLAGKYPYPTRLVPRFGNRVLPVSSDRSLQTTLGFGGGTSTGLGRYFQAGVLGGYYGGALGGELRLRVVSKFDFHLATYGVEYSNDYQSFNQRLFQATLQFDL